MTKTVSFYKGKYFCRDAVMLIFFPVLKDAVRTSFEVLVLILVLVSQVLVFILVV